MKTTELAYRVYRHYRTYVNPEVHHYYGIVANYGLVNLAEIAGVNSAEYQELVEVLSAFPDHVSHPRYNFPSYFICGIAKARALWNGIWKEGGSVREYAEEMMHAQRDRGGIVSHPFKNPQRVWIDVATAVTPYLLFSGLALGEMRYIDEAAFQTLAMFDLFRDPENGLLHQSRDCCGEGKLSADHWSRGNGWGALPIAELAVHLPKDHPEKARCIEYFQRLMKALLPYQTENGMWRQEITLPELDGHISYEETSGTGLILYAMGMGIRNGLLDRETYLPVLEVGIRGLCHVSIMADGATQHSCPGCLCPGDGSIAAYLSHRPSFVNEPHGAGPVILALAEAYRNGLTEC